MNLKYHEIPVNKLFFLLLLSHVYLFFDPANGSALQLNSKNIDKTLASNELVVINFYAEWCHFSQILAPKFEDAAAEVSRLIQIPVKL